MNPEKSAGTMYSRDKVRQCIQRVADEVGNSRPTPAQYRELQRELHMPISVEEIYWEYGDFTKAVEDAYRHRDED